MPNEISTSKNNQGTGTETQTTRLSPTYTIPEGEFCVFGKVYAHPHHASALARVYEETTRLADSEPGVIYYSISQEPADTDAGSSGKEGGGGEKKRSRVFYFFEQYTGREAFEAHNRKPLKGVGSVGPAGK